MPQNNDNKVGDQIKTLAKDVAKKYALVLLKPVLIGVIIIMFFLMLIGSYKEAIAGIFSNSLFSIFGTKDENGNITNASFNNLVKISSNSTGYYWEFVDDIDETVKKTQEELEKNASKYSKDEVLKKLIKAELKSELPNLGGVPEDNENCFQGCINIQNLSFIESSEFATKKENNEDLGSYFTINENGNVVTANREIDLKATVVGKYILPVEYISYFYLVTDEEDFTVALAENVDNSYINITIDNTELVIDEAKVWCVKFKNENGEVSIDSSESDKNSFFVKKFIEYKLHKDIDTEFLYKYIQENSRTASMLEMTKYLIFLATGENQGNVDNYDFVQSGKTVFKTVSSQGGYEFFKRFLHEWEGCKYNFDKTKYIVYIDGGDNLTVGYGIDIKTSEGGKILRQRYGDALQVGFEIPVEEVDELVDLEIELKMNDYETKLGSLNLTEYQKYALISRMYNCGTNGAIGARKNEESFLSAYKKYWNQEIDDKYGQTLGESIYNHDLYIKYMDTPITSGNGVSPGLIARRRDEWLLFTTGYSERLGEFCPNYDSSEFLDVARSVWDIVCNGNYRYGGSSIPCDIGQIDCSAYVSWVLYEYGYLDFGGVQHNTTLLLKDNYTEMYGWEEVLFEGNENIINQLQSGDIVVRRDSGNSNAHVTLVVEVKNGRVYGYDCGNVDNWNGIKSRDPDTNAVDVTWFFTSHPGAGKIIRVTKK